MLLKFNPKPEDLLWENRTSHQSPSLVLEPFPLYSWGNHTRHTKSAVLIQTRTLSLELSLALQFVLLVELQDLLHR